MKVRHVLEFDLEFALLEFNWGSELTQSLSLFYTVIVQ